MLSTESLGRLLSKTYEVCDYVIRNSPNLPLGSHTASELHNYYSERFGKKYVSKYWTYAGTSSNDGFYTEGIDPYSVLTIHDGEQEISIPAGTIFDFTRMLEEQSGLSGKNAHLFTVRNHGDLVASQSISFPSQKEMTRFASSKGKRFPKGSDSFSFSLVDGSVVGQIRYYGVVRLDCIDFNRGVLPDISFKLKVGQLKRLYDTCKLELYQDHATRRYSIMITNPDGVVVASDKMVTEDGKHDCPENGSTKTIVDRSADCKLEISNPEDTSAGELSLADIIKEPTHISIDEAAKRIFETEETDSGSTAVTSTEGTVLTDVAASMIELDLHLSDQLEEQEEYVNANNEISNDTDLNVQGNSTTERNNSNYNENCISLERIEPYYPDTHFCIT